MDENKRKHLEFIQNVITRMNSNSFLIKGWAITLVSALFALAAKDANVKYVMVTYISIPIFWGLDAYYLSLERQYRKLYEEVSAKNESAIDYSMDASSHNKGNDTWLSTMFSGTVWSVYVTIIVITGCVMYLFKAH
jgi:hypothetical protein